MGWKGFAEGLGGGDSTQRERGFQGVGRAGNPWNVTQRNGFPRKSGAAAKSAGCQNKNPTGPEQHPELSGVGATQSPPVLGFLAIPAVGRNQLRHRWGVQVLFQPFPVPTFPQQPPWHGSSILGKGELLS